MHQTASVLYILTWRWTSRHSGGLCFVSPYCPKFDSKLPGLEPMTSHLLSACCTNWAKWTLSLRCKRSISTFRTYRKRRLCQTIAQIGTTFRGASSGPIAELLLEALSERCLTCLCNPPISDWLIGTLILLQKTPCITGQCPPLYKMIVKDASCFSQ